MVKTSVRVRLRVRVRVRVSALHLDRRDASRYASSTGKWRGSIVVST